MISKKVFALGVIALAVAACGNPPVLDAEWKAHCKTLASERGRDADGAKRVYEFCTTEGRKNVETGRYPAPPGFEAMVKASPPQKAEAPRRREDHCVEVARGNMGYAYEACMRGEAVGTDAGLQAVVSACEKYYSRDERVLGAAAAAERYASCVNEGTARVTGKK